MERWFSGQAFCPVGEPQSLTADPRGQTQTSEMQPVCVIPCLSAIENYSFDLFASYRYQPPQQGWGQTAMKVMMIGWRI